MNWISGKRSVSKDCGVWIYALVWRESRRIYIGQTRRLFRRVREHARQHPGWTACLVLDYLPQDPSRAEAEQREMWAVVQFARAGWSVLNRKHAAPALLDWLRRGHQGRTGW